MSHLFGFYFPRIFIFRKAVLFSLLSVFLLMLLANNFVNATQSDEDLLTRIETTLNELAKNDLFSGSVLVAHDSDILLSAGYGLANREWDIPNSPDTKFRLASLTKQFTAMSILILQERGLLTTQDHACQYFEECPEAWQDITIEHLLHHTSGIPGNYYDMRGFEPTRSISPSKLIELFIDAPLHFQPGTGWEYSDSGYIVLGHIIEVASDQAYGRFLRENIFDPLGMADIDYDAGRGVIKYRAEGYARPTQHAADFHISNSYASYGLSSTVEDLYRWDQALYSGEVVSQESWDAMLAAAVPMSGVPPYSHGLYGLGMGSLDDHPFIRHDGGMDGFTSSMVHFTDDNVTIIVLSNLESAPSALIVDTIASMVFDAG
jgi:CubicO group peptidase (beta-lactamase class C family)